MKLGGLFSGIGGFELAWERLGHEVAWVCEIDKSVQRVLRERFPNAVIYDDVSELDPSEVEAVDVLTGGSPCQGFSVAGQRTGLEHGESRLFADYVRIVDGLAERGLRYAVWENVPGVLSITNDDGEFTYEHVVAALVGSAEPVRLDRSARWNTGMAARAGRAVAWRVLDSRYFGVPQRRRRIFAVVAVGRAAEDRAGRALLAVAEGVRRDPETGDAARQDAARRADGRPRVPSVAGALGVTHGGDDLDRMTFVPDLPEETGPLTTGCGHPRGTESTDSSHVLVDRPEYLTQSGEDWVPPLVASDSAAVGNTQDGKIVGVATGPAVVPIQDAREIEKDQGGSGFGEPDGPSYTLDSTSRHAVGPVPYRKSRRAQTDTDDETWIADGQANTLTPFDTGDTRTTHAVVEPMPPARSFNWQQGDAEYELADDASTLADRTRPAVLVPDPTLGDLVRQEGLAFDGYNQNLDVGVHQTLRSNRDGGDFVADPAGMTYGVRRLTPVECERLQGFPDGWTEPARSDSARYKALGNAVTVNTVGWILRRISELEALGSADEREDDRGD